jgi:hypothetical protein
MVSLLDIAEAQKTVAIRGQDIPVYGISAEGIAHLLGAFPELRKMFAGKATEITPEQMMNLAPRAVASAIAAGTGLIGDPKAEAMAAKLSIGEQLELLAAIFDLTFPQGLGPFLDRLDALGVRDPAVSGWAQDMKSPAPSKS